MAILQNYQTNLPKQITSHLLLSFVSPPQVLVNLANLPESSAYDASPSCWGHPLVFTVCAPMRWPIWFKAWHSDLVISLRFPVYHLILADFLLIFGSARACCSMAHGLYQSVKTLEVRVHVFNHCVEAMAVLICGCKVWMIECFKNWFD